MNPEHFIYRRFHHPSNRKAAPKAHLMPVMWSWLAALAHLEDGLWSRPVVCPLVVPPSPWPREVIEQAPNDMPSQATPNASSPTLGIIYPKLGNVAHNQIINLFVTLGISMG